MVKVILGEFSISVPALLIAIYMIGSLLRGLATILPSTRQALDEWLARFVPS